MQEPWKTDKWFISPWNYLPEVTKGSGSEPDVFYYDEKVTFSVPVVAPKTLKPGTHTVSIEATYTVCSGNICLRPATAVLSVAIAYQDARRPARSLHGVLAIPGQAFEPWPRPSVRCASAESTQCRAVD